jgi:DUF4097 and DUF4098 domain-containing protein YvlB
MKTTFVVGLLILGTLTASAATEQEQRQRFAIQPGQQLVVDVDFGSIDIQTNATQEVAIHVWRKIGRKSKAEEESFLKDYPVTFNQDSGTVTVRAQHKAKSSWSFFGGRTQNEAKYTITVPARFNVRLHTSGGGIAVRDVSGTVAAGTSGGGLDFARLEGTLDGHTSGGGIRVADCRGKLKISTSGGGIDVAGGSGTLVGDTSGGSVKVRDFGGPARVETSGGGITIERVAGAVEGSTSGGSVQAVLLSPLPGAVKLSTSGGGVTARVPEGTSFELDAETSGGGVSSQLPVTISGKPAGNRLKGPVNGGGKLVELRSSGGSIRVEKLESRAARN